LNFLFGIQLTSVILQGSNIYKLILESHVIL